MNTKRKKQKRPTIPQGYCLLKTGDRRVKGYKWWSPLWPETGFMDGNEELYGCEINGTLDEAVFIAPIRRKRK